MKRLLAVITVLLSACAAPQKKPSMPPSAQQWQAHQQQLGQIQQWNIHGRVAIASEDNGGHADLIWQQKNRQHYDIKLIAPFGSGTSHLQKRAGYVSLTTSSGQSIVESSLDALVSQIEDLHFPVQGIAWWILGMPAPDSSARLLNWNEAGYLQLLEQDGWRVEMNNYRAVSRYQLPKKIFMNRIDNEEVEVRLVIRQWGIQ